MRRHSPSLVAGLAIVLCCGAYLRLNASTPVAGPLLEAKRIVQSLDAGLGRLIDSTPVVGRLVRATRNVRSEHDATSEAVAPPLLTTDKTGYLGGQTVVIRGTGLAPDEVVTLQVTHLNGGAEAGGGHDAFTAAANAGGSVSASWALNDDVAGNSFLLHASGSSTGQFEPVPFGRIAVVGTDK